MSNAAHAKHPSSLNDAVRSAWNEIAPFWDERMGEGNDFHKLLVEPPTDRLLAPQPGERILEIACGNGAYTRHLADLGVQVLACDVSEVFITRATERSTSHPERVAYRVLDATDESQLLALGKRGFDSAVCNMALMDMAEIEPLFSALKRLLTPTGRFVFSVMHPCFNNYEGTRIVAEEVAQGHDLVPEHAVKVLRYVQASVSEGIGIHGQPTPHYYFHRPLSELFRVGFNHGFALDGLEEPVFTEDVERGRPLSWAHLREIPPVLVARMRLLNP